MKDQEDAFEGLGEMGFCKKWGQEGFGEQDTWY